MLVDTNHIVSLCIALKRTRDRLYSRVYYIAHGRNTVAGLSDQAGYSSNRSEKPEGPGSGFHPHPQRRQWPPAKETCIMTIGEAARALQAGVGCVLLVFYYFDLRPAQTG